MRLATATPLALALAALAALPLLAGTAADPPARPPPAEQEREKDEAYPPELRARVNKAVDRGVALLLARQKEDGSWATDGPDLKHHRLGVTALCALACLEGGIAADDQRLEKAFGFLRTLPLEKTYSVSVLLMALHARYGGIDDAFAQDGTDAYGNPAKKDPCLTRMNATDREWMEKAVAYLVQHQSQGTWRYPEMGYDLSNTQYALLGLWAASRCGAKVPQEVWSSALEALLGLQERTGPETLLRLTEARGEYRVVFTEKARRRGFRYRPEDTLTGSMTAAGMAGLAICQDELWASRRFPPEQRDRTRKGIRDAMAWLQENFDVTRNPGHPGGGWHFYWLYGLERAGILARTRFLGSKDWYLEGATWLLGNQRSDGGWQTEHLLLDTAFGVLFLKRSTLRARQPVITPADPGR